MARFTHTEEVLANELTISRRNLEAAKALHWKEIQDYRNMLAGRDEYIAQLEAQLEGVRQAWFNGEAYTETIRKQLRIECEDIGDQDWPDDLHLADVIDKHLARPARRRITELEDALSGEV